MQGGCQAEHDISQSCWRMRRACTGEVLFDGIPVKLWSVFGSPEEVALGRLRRNGLLLRKRSAFGDRGCHPARGQDPQRHPAGDGRRCRLAMPGAQSQGRLLPRGYSGYPQGGPGFPEQFERLLLRLEAKLTRLGGGQFPVSLASSRRVPITFSSLRETPEFASARRETA